MAERAEIALPSITPQETAQFPNSFSPQLRLTHAPEPPLRNSFKYPDPELRYYRGIGYASYSEAACGTLLEKYIPGFRVIEGKTFQVPVHPDWSPNPKSIDFFVEGVFLEFHPPRFWREGRKFGDFAYPGEYFKFRRKIDQCRSPQEKAKVKEVTRATLVENYYQKRARVIDCDPTTKGTELVVGTSAGDLYDKVIRRFSPNPPSRAQFIREFDAVIDDAVMANTPVSHPQRRTYPQRRAA